MKLANLFIKSNLKVYCSSKESTEFNYYESTKMYSVHVTPGRSTERNKNSDDMDNEIRAYRGRRKESISVKLINYIRSQFQSDAIPGESEKV